MRTVFIECDRFLSRDERRATLESMKYEAGDDVRIVLLAPGMHVAEPASQWIPCSERLPEKYSDVLCCDTYGEYIIGMPYEDEESNTGFSVENDGVYMIDCIAWMPLPEPYREDN